MQLHVLNLLLFSRELFVHVGMSHCLSVAVLSLSNVWE